MRDRKFSATAANTFCTCVANEMANAFVGRELPYVLELGRGTADEINRMQVGRLDVAMSALARTSTIANASCEKR